ncbi:MAG: AMP-binding protein [Rudanella sp.]|nr:AMP-binding protein [Rudanella sp.]
MQAATQKETSLLTLVDKFYEFEKTQPTKVFLRQPVGDSFIDFTYAEAGRQARTLATYFHSLGLPPGSNIGLISKNCAHWIIADIAIMISGHVSVPFYATLTADQIRHVLEHSGCPVTFVGKLDDWKGMKSGVPKDIVSIQFPDYEAPDHDLVQWNDIMDKNEPMTGEYRPSLDDLFTIIYTSGTTGNPKGVMMPFRAMAEALYKTKPLMRYDLAETRFFSYLPLCHIAERNLVESTCIMTGGTIYFAETLESFGKNLAAAQPTHFLAVPRIWTKFQLGILAKMPQKKMDMFFRIPILGNIVKKKIREGLGLNDAKLILTGAAPMPTALIRWFRRLGIVIQEAYGMSENLGAVSMMPIDNIKDGTVGQLYPGMEVKIDPITGEIATRSPWNMIGYYREPDLTAQTIRDGWLYTGDVGEVDDERFLKITGRVKEMYKTAKGEYVAPAQIEFGFSDNNLIEQICVAGQSLPQPMALVVLSDLGRAAHPDSVTDSLMQTLNALNPKLHSYERVKKVVVVSDAWTVENNRLTPTMKIKRNVVEAHYNPFMEDWYERAEAVVWE